MKFTSEVTINLPRARVVELFDNPDNMKLWQKGLESFEPLSGTPGQPGAQAKLVYEMNGRRMELIETVTVRNLPDEFNGTYDAGGMHNIRNNRFVEVDAEHTRWVSETEYQFGGYMRLLGPFMQGSLKHQSQQIMDDFKVFAEQTGS